MGRVEFSDECVPGSQNLSFLQTLFQAELFHYPGQKFSRRLRAIRSRRIERQASPFGDDGAAKRRSHEIGEAWATDSILPAHIARQDI
jgi:hypothetical protein